MSNYVIINGHKVITQYVYPPVPFRDMDWNAVTDEYDGAPDAGHQCMGHGATEQEAINALLDCLIEHELEKLPPPPPVRCAFNMGYVPPAAPVRDAPPDFVGWTVEPTRVREE